MIRILRIETSPAFPRVVSGANDHPDRAIFAEPVRRASMALSANSK
jgi:hypothetical protein